MKIVIDIDEGSYNRIKDGNALLNDLGALWKSTKNGKPYEDRPQGEWTNKHFEHADCSVCGGTNDYHGDFCKYCGADMRGKEE